MKRKIREVNHKKYISPPANVTEPEIGICAGSVFPGHLLLDKRLRDKLEEQYKKEK